MENEDVHFASDFSFITRKQGIHVEGISGIAPIKPDDHQAGERKNKKEEAPHKEETQDRFDELTKATAASNEILVKSHSPYRFCVYRKEKEIFIDLVTLNKDGKIGALKMENITHDDYVKWMRHIEEREGLFLDEIG